MPGYGYMLAYALLLAVMAGLVVSPFAGVSGGVTTALLAVVVLVPLLTIAYLLASYPDRHTHMHA